MNACVYDTLNIFKLILSLIFVYECVVCAAAAVVMAFDSMWILYSNVMTCRSGLFAKILLRCSRSVFVVVDHITKMK